jgi:hypothetical protein
MGVVGPQMTGIFENHPSFRAVMGQYLCKPHISKPKDMHAEAALGRRRPFPQPSTPNTRRDT